MREPLDLYADFLEFREDFINTAITTSVYTESRGAIGRVRPLVRIETPEQLDEVKSQINQWDNYVSALCAADPIRFQPDNKNFSPAPKILGEITSLSVTENMAVSTRLITRERIIQRLTSLYNREYSLVDDPDNNSRVKRLKKEIEFFQDEKEEKYRIRSNGYKESLVIYKQPGDNRAKKMRIPLSGLFYYDPDKTIPLTMPKEIGRAKPRFDSTSSLRTNPIPCSLPFGGWLYRESDLETGRKQAKELAKFQAKKEEDERKARAKARKEREKQAREDAKAHRDRTAATSRDKRSEAIKDSLSEAKERAKAGTNEG
ncbi:MULTISPECIES: hypothetical protein [Shewanella]|uniref:hypothetical protein n=1 Tax=Shewanella TaxID=22 RepID=UPI001AAE4B7B|nr:hypothetical protein [Shewanella algae]MBO2580249.1 hypothetical protein [Shewanella algae]HDS1207836.1 hypothetical protein [Shewanella algae]